MEVRVYFESDGVARWCQRLHPTGVQAIPPGPNPFSVTTSALVLSAHSRKDLFNGLQNFNYSIIFGPTSRVNYEYWATEDRPAAWTLNNTSGMKYAGLTKSLYGTHRVVFNTPGRYLPMNRSLPMFTLSDAVPGTQVALRDLHVMLQSKTAYAKGEGVGTAVETFVTDVFGLVSGFVT